MTRKEAYGFDLSSSEAESMATRLMPYAAAAAAAAAAAEKTVDEQAADQAVAGRRAVAGKVQCRLDASAEVDSEASAPEAEDAVPSKHPQVLTDRAHTLAD